MSDVILLDWLQDGLQRVNEAVEVSRPQRPDTQNGNVATAPAGAARAPGRRSFVRVIAAFASATWRACWESAGEQSGETSNSTGRLIYRLFDEAVQAMEAVRASITGREELADQSQYLERLDAAMAEVRRVRADLEPGWLWFTKEDEEEAKASIAKGEGVDVEEAFAQMAGLTLDELRAKVEAHKRKYHTNGDAAR